VRRDHHATNADPWWNADTASIDLDAPVVRPSGSAATRRRRPVRQGLVPVLLAVLTAPLRWIVRRFQRSARLRRLGARALVLGAVLCIIAGSVGVILLNNVVIGRTAELGKLDDQRRELRRDNAGLNAKTSRLSAPDVVVKKAEKELGMVNSPEMPKYIYLLPDSRPLTPEQRRAVAAKQRRVAALLERRRQAAAKEAK
jgi:hypothetical protein